MNGRLHLSPFLLIIGFHIGVPPTTGILGNISHSLPSVGQRLFNYLFGSFFLSTIGSGMLSHGRLFTLPPLQLFPLQVRVFFIVSQYMIPLSSIGQKRETSVNLLWKLAVCFCFFLGTYSYCFFVLFYLGLVGRQLSVCFFTLLYFFLVFPHHPPNCTYLGSLTVFHFLVVVVG